jgi:hypothetical protein
MVDSKKSPVNARKKRGNSRVRVGAAAMCKVGIPFLKSPLPSLITLDTI